MRMSMELMIRNRKQQNSNLFVSMLFVNMLQVSGPKYYSIKYKMKRLSTTVFRESSITDNNNKRNA